MSELPHFHLRLRRSLPADRPPRLHPMGCRCHRCDPWKVRKVEHANAAALRTIIGLALGAMLVLVLDAAIGGPGPLSLFGIGS